MTDQRQHGRIWTGRASHLPLAAVQLEQAIDHLEWRPTGPGFGEDSAAAGGLLQFVLQHGLQVTHYARSDDYFPPFRLCGLRSAFSTGVARAYFVESGTETMLVAWDYFPKQGVFPPPASAPPDQPSGGEPFRMPHANLTRCEPGLEPPRSRPA